MKKTMRHLSLRVDDDLLRRFSYVARYNGRTMNSTLLLLIRRYVARFEEENGRIELTEEDDELQ